MKAIFTSLLPALLASAAAAAAIAPEARGADVPAQCAWNGYTQTDYNGQATAHQSIVQQCQQLPPSPVLPGLLSAKVTLGQDVCLFSSSLGCEGEGLTITTKGNPNLRSQPTFHYWKCGPCVVPPSA